MCAYWLVFEPTKLG